MFFQRQGEVADRPHLNLPSGTYEEEHGLEGFYGAVSHLYHEKPPTSWTDLRRSPFQWAPIEEQRADFLKPQCFQPPSDGSQKDFFQGGECWFFNDEIRLWWHRFSVASSVFFRNADASELYFCHDGKARLESVYGEIALEKGDYVLIPKGVTYRWALDDQAMALLRIENLKSHFQRPDTALMGQHALYSEHEIEGPLLKKGGESGSTVRVQSEFEISEIEYAHDVRDLKGWVGNLYPYKLNISKISPALSSKAHLPPSVNSTFVAQDFVVCSFLPRPLEEPEGALKVPFFHSNIDYDEVILYHEGDFFSRDHMEAGCISFHPRGVHHGPHPKALKNQSAKTRTDEVAVMIDTRNPLRATAYARKREIREYWKSWRPS
ncbi:MAG: homogentisate 1,2-dioxygenase [Bradymonadales bacterium]|nr:MAG: homogentisate 1,2-dioxygenase [Bradymonadales bacterium]